MTENIGLFDPANYDAFCGAWRSVAMDEAEKWCADPAVQAMLADAVLVDFRCQYRDRKPPEHMEFFIRAQICLVFSETGQNPVRLSNYTALRMAEFPPLEPITKGGDPADAPKAPADATLKPDAPAAAVPIETPAETAPKEAPAGARQMPASGKWIAQRRRARRKKTQDGKTADAPKPKAPAPTRPDTFIDPNRTVMWMPGDVAQTEHIVQEVVLPDEEEDDEERSNKLSLLNTLLFITMIVAFAFMIYESRLIQHYFL